MPTPTAIHISQTLDLPMSYVTSTVVVLAKKRAGKTYFAQVICEELLAAQRQVIALDPTSAWWGLRSSADGRHAGLPIAVFGGEHGDVPLEVGAGKAIAEAVVDERFSVIIDTSLFDVREEQKFVHDFLRTLYRKNRQPLHLFCDEADLFAPETPKSRDGWDTLAAMESIVRRGGIKGIGCTMITQKPQVISKNVISQADILVALRMTHHLDIKQIDKWVAVHGDTALAHELSQSLPALPVGDAWIWAPALDIFERVTVRKKKTFDSGKTPDVDGAQPPPKVLAPIDIQRLGDTIAATVERAKDNDPDQLRAKIRELETRARDGAQNGTLAQVNYQALERAKARIAELEGQLASLRFFETTMDAAQDKVVAEIDEAITRLTATRNAFADAATEWSERDRVNGHGHAIAIDAHEVDEVQHQSWAHVGAAGPNNAKLGAGPRRILTVLAQYRQGRTKSQLAVLAGYAGTGGGFRNYVSALRTAKYLEGGDDHLQITAAGLQVLGAYTPLPKGDELFRYWLGHRKVGQCGAAILKVLRDARGPLAPAAIADRTVPTYEATGGGFRNTLSRLRTLELVRGYDQISLADELRG